MPAIAEIQMSAVWLVHSTRSADQGACQSKALHLPACRPTGKPLHMVPSRKMSCASSTLFLVSVLAKGNSMETELSLQRLSSPTTSEPAW